MENRSCHCCKRCYGRPSRRGQDVNTVMSVPASICSVWRLTGDLSGSHDDAACSNRTVRNRVSYAVGILCLSGVLRLSPMKFHWSAGFTRRGALHGDFGARLPIAGERFLRKSRATSVFEFWTQPIFDCLNFIFLNLQSYTVRVIRIVEYAGQLRVFGLNILCQVNMKI